MTSLAVLTGLALGFGLVLVNAWARARKLTLAARIAPYVRASVADEMRGDVASVTPFPTIERLLAPVLRDGVRAVEKWGSPSGELRVRLERAGNRTSVEQFRTEQVLCGIAGLIGGVALAVLLTATRGASVLAVSVLTLVCALAGVAVRDWLLTREVSKRQQRLVAELPTVAELLALSVSAGEGALGALERVARTTHGVMAEELSATLSHARTGTPLPQALQHMGDRSGLPALRRFADGIATAVERGTPLADVLRAQATDVRAEGRRALMEEGGKREIAMLVPVVFLILPVTVVFAVYPGLVAIKLDF